MPTPPAAAVHEDAFATSQVALAERRIVVPSEWKVLFFSEKLVLEPASGPPLALGFDDFVAHAEVISAGLVVRKDHKRIFILDEETRVLLRAWLEPFVERQLARNLRRRVFSAMLWAVVIAAQNAIGLVTWSIYLVVPGLLMVAMAFVRPRRELYLAEAALWLVLAANCALIAFATRSVLALVPVLFVPPIIRQDWTLYGFYGPTRTTLGKSFRGD